MPLVRNSKRSAMNCTALHRGAIRFDAVQCDAAQPQLPPTSSRCFSPGSSQADSANLEFSLTLLWGAEAVPNRAVACALCTGCAPLPQQQYDRPTWWRQCHLDVNWQKRSRSRNFGRDEWHMYAQVQRCAVLVEPDRRVASISKTIKGRRGSLREGDASRHVMWSCHKDVLTE